MFGFGVILMYLAEYFGRKKYAKKERKNAKERVAKSG
jgi:hypothetical protein